LFTEKKKTHKGGARETLGWPAVTASPYLTDPLPLRHREMVDSAPTARKNDTCNNRTDSQPPKKDNTPVSPPADQSITPK